MTSKQEMTSIPINANERHRIATKVFANGYEPVPLSNGSKGCYLPGWTRAAINIAEHFNPRAQGGVGIRNGVPIDQDIADLDILYDVNRLRVSILGATSMRRVGRAPRELWVYGGEVVSGASIKIEKEGETAQVEILGQGKQYAAYHTHPDTGLPYVWGISEPLNTPIDTLHVVTQEQIKTFIHEVNALLIEFVDDEGWAIVGDTTDAQDSGEAIPAERVFQTEHMTFTAAQVLSGELGGDPIRCGWAGCNHAYSAGIWHPDGEDTRLYDFGTGCVHYVEGHGPIEEDEMFNLMESLGKHLPAADGTFLGKEIVNSVPPTMTGEEALLYISSRYAYESAGDMVWCMYSRTVFQKMAAFKNSYPQKVNRPTRDKPEVAKWVSVIDIWKGQRELFRAPLFDPRTQDLWSPGDGIVADDRYINTYRAPVLGDASRGDVGGFLYHIERMVPDKREMTAVLDWCAALLSSPDKRLVTLLMVAPNVYGTGRGILFNMLSAALGLDYCAEIDAAQITCNTGQDKYTGWLSRNLLVHVPEITATEAVDNTYSGHKAAYERMKELLDPGKTRMSVKEKYKVEQVLRVYVSTFIASNHINCIAMPVDDRRILAVMNTRKKMTAAQVADALAWYANLDNLAALLVWARKWVRTVYVNDSMPADTETKVKIAEAAVPPITAAILDVINDFHGMVFYEEQVLAKINPTSAKIDQYSSIIRSVCHENYSRVDPDNPRKKFRAEKGRGAKIVRPWVKTGDSDAILRLQLTTNTALVVSEIMKNN